MKNKLLGRFDLDECARSFVGSLSQWRQCRRMNQSIEFFTDAFALAKAKLAELNEQQVPFSDAPRHGDRSPYFVNYVDLAPQPGPWIVPLIQNVQDHAAMAQRRVCRLRDQRLQQRVDLYLVLGGSFE